MCQLRENALLPSKGTFEGKYASFGSFYKTLVINKLDKTASQNILFHITGKPVPHVRKGFSATPDRLIRDTTKAFPQCENCFLEA